MRIKSFNLTNGRIKIHSESTQRIINKLAFLNAKYETETIILKCIIDSRDYRFELSTQEANELIAEMNRMLKNENT